MGYEVDIKEIKKILESLNKKLDALVVEQEIRSLMMITQGSLENFLVGEPNLYSATDLKVVYR